MSKRAAYIVTGGAGFVGANLVAALQARQPRPHVVVVDTFRSGTFANLTEACARRGQIAFEGEVLPVSTREIELDRLIERAEAVAVFHLAAITDTTLADEREMIRENVGGFRAMLVACASRGVPLVYASSAATYGPAGAARKPLALADAGRPSNVYGFSKWLMEREHERLAEERRDAGLTTPWIVGLRYFNVFGPGEAGKGKMASMVFQLAKQMLADKRPRLFTDGSQARDQVYVDDIVDCTLAAAGLGSKPDPRPGVYNAGSGEATSFNDIVAALRGPLRATEHALLTDYFPMPDSIRQFYQDFTCADLSETTAALGWRPRWRPLDAIADYARFLARSPAAPAADR
ncbi:MAG: NAD-dependent epimerase/dehydratase family protein [Phycisphaerales bacterium]